MEANRSIVNPDPGSEAPNDGGPDGAGSCPKPEAPSSDRGARWTDAEWAAEAVALSRRQADAARAEARELRAELVEAHRAHRESCDASLPIEAERDKLRAIVESDRALAGEASEAWAVLTGRDSMQTRPVSSCVTEARRVVAELSERRADVEAYKLTVANMMRMLGRSPSTDLRLAELAVGAEVKEVDKLREELAETRAALEAARAAVHTPSPGGCDPATRTRALPVVPAVPVACGGCDMCRWPVANEYGRCGHPMSWSVQVDPMLPPPEACGVRAELAKAGGL